MNYNLTFSDGSIPCVGDTCTRHGGREMWEKTTMAMVAPLQTLTQLDFASLSPRGGLFPSPSAWEDQVFYFLMLDRFSDGQENGYKDNAGNLVQGGTTPLYSPANPENAVKTEADAARWREATKYVGGTLKGLQSKIGYLKRLGVMALWISPIFKQVRFQETYHGYGIQNFLEVEPHFGTREDLQEVVPVAHAHGIYAILDIILNHAGNVFSYAGDRYIRESMFGGEFGAFRTRGVHFFNEDNPVYQELAKILDIRR